jgi:DNA mismatch repair protein MutS
VRRLLADAAIARCAPHRFDAAGFDASAPETAQSFRTSSLRGYGVEELPLAQDAAALVLDYLKDTHLGSLGHVRRLGVLATDEWMLLDNATRRNLELVQSLRDGGTRGTLFGLLDETRTGAGARLLKKWILQPLLQQTSHRQPAGCGAGTVGRFAVARRCARPAEKYRRY